MKPPPRKKIASRSKDLQIEEYSRWKLSERKLLLKALEKYSVNQSLQIAKMVETKSEVEVIYYLSKLKRSLKTDTSVATSSEHRKYIRNIQNRTIFIFNLILDEFAYFLVYSLLFSYHAWIRFTHQLIDNQEQSYSSMIGKLLALYGQNCFKKLHSTGVNFKLIYEYLAGLCVGVQYQALPPLESAVVLDLLRNVATNLGKCNTAQHKEFVLMNFQKQVFPTCTQPVNKNLFAEVVAPPNSLLSSLPSSSKTEICRMYKEIGKSDDTNATAVCTEDFQLQDEKMTRGTWYRMPKTAKVPQPSQYKRNFPASWNTESVNNSSTSTVKIVKILPGISTHDAQTEFSEEIPSTAASSSDLQEGHHSESEQSNRTFLTSEDIKQEFQEENDVSDSSSDQEIDNSDNNKKQTPIQTQIIPVTNASERLCLQSGEESPQVPVEGTGLHLPNENTGKKNMDNTDVVAKQSGDTVQKGSIVSNILQTPIKVIIVQGTPGGPEGGQIPKPRNLLSHLFQCPIEDVCQSKAESFRTLPNLQKTVDRLDLNVHDRSVLSNLLQSSNADTTQQGAGNMVKALQATSQAEGEFSDFCPPQGSGTSRGKSEDCQVNERAADQESCRLVITNVKGSAAFQPNERQSSDKAVDTESTDFDGSNDKFMYTPSISWLNPMNIPAHLINFTEKE